MDPLSGEVNALLTRGYEQVAEMEQHMLRDLRGMDVTISELHMMEYIGSGGSNGRSISDIAMKSGKTLPSITVAIQKLEKRGYVEKLKHEKDGRRVCVTLTRQGRRADAAHRYFHRNMVNGVLGRMAEGDKQSFLNGLRILNEFFDHTLHGMDQREGADDANNRMGAISK